jgi:hypothetical protein
MPERSGREVGGAAEGRDRFDGEAVRRILQRAAEEQHRLNNALADSYSLEELEEMAAEARISPEAVRKAIEAQGADPGAAARAASVPTARSTTPWFAALARWMPGLSPAVKRILLASTGGVVVVGLLVAFPVVAEVLYLGALLALLMLALLVLLGVSPF